MHRLLRLFLALVTAFGAAGASACSSSHGSTKAFCETLRSGDNPLTLFNHYDPTNVATAHDQLDRATERLRQLHDAAPLEIRDDLQVLVDVADRLVAALDPAAAGQPAPDFASDAPRIESASGAVTSFASQECGVDLSG